MPFCIIAMAHSLWTLCEHGNIWQPLNASCKINNVNNNQHCKLQEYWNNIIREYKYSKQQKSDSS